MVSVDLYVGDSIKLEEVLLLAVGAVGKRDVLLWWHRLLVLLREAINIKSSVCRLFGSCSFWCGFVRCLYGIIRVGQERKQKPLIDFVGACSLVTQQAALLVEGGGDRSAALSLTSIITRDLYTFRRT